MSFLTQIFENLRNEPERAKVVEAHATTLRGTDGTGILDLIGRARAFMSAAGVKPGDRVALLAPNSVRWVAADLAIIAQGAIVVPLYDRQEPAELAVVLGSAKPTLVVAADRDLAQALEAAWTDRGDCRIATFDEAFEPEPTDAPHHEHGPEETVAIIYTSGTSGEPKGVMLSRANLDFMLEQTVQRLGKAVAHTGRARARSGEPDRVFHYLPFCFAASRMMLWTQLSRPNPLMISTDLDKLIVEIATAKPHYFLNVPAVLERIRSGVGTKLRERGGIAQELYERGQKAYRAVLAGRASFFDRVTLGAAEKVVFSKIKQQIGPNLEFLISGSAPLAEDTQRWFQMLGIRVYQAYGLTETTGIVTLDEPERTVPGRVGAPLEGVQTKVGEGGELLVRGPNVFSGYWRNEQATEQAIVDGWFHTGDQVNIEEHNLKIIGRIKNLLVPESGHNVAPEPLEEKFMKHCPEAEQCMVVGHGRPFLVVLVTGNPPVEAVDRALEAASAGQPFYKKLKRAVRVDETFTPENGLLTANRKLRRQVIEGHFKAQIDQVYEAYLAEKEEKARQQEASRS